jgi:hypothetical protein
LGKVYVSNPGGAISATTAMPPGIATQHLCRAGNLCIQIRKKLACELFGS